jgi:hypothetical protein
MSEQMKPQWIGVRRTLGRSEAIEQYIILRLRTEDLNRLDFLVRAFHENRIALPEGSPFSAQDLKDTARTAFLGWFATLVDRDDRVVYAFDCLLALFPDRMKQIVRAQLSLEAIYEKLQQFRNNVAFHARSSISAHIAARRNFVNEDTYLDLTSAISDFQALTKVLRAEELAAIPELPQALEDFRVSHHPAFAPLEDRAPDQS